MADQDAPVYKIVQGVPAAVVRSYKEPRYDSELILAATPNTEFVLYSKPVGQTLNDGTTRKTLLHTNQTQASTLGTPVSFDLYGFNARLLSESAKTVTKGNFDLVMARMLSQVIFGQDNTYLNIPVEDIPSGVDIEGLGATDSPHIGLGVSENLYRFDVGGRGIHINSTESYAVKISFPSGLSGITGNLLLKWYMRGITYKGV
jgi:hypothetical protein